MKRQELSSNTDSLCGLPYVMLRAAQPWKVDLQKWFWGVQNLTVSPLSPSDVNSSPKGFTWLLVQQTALRLGWCKVISFQPGVSSQEMSVLEAKLCRHLCKLTAGKTSGMLQMKGGFSRPAKTTLELYVPVYKLILVQVVFKLHLS